MTLTEQLEEARERIRELEAALRPSGIAFYLNLSPTMGQSVILETLLHAAGPIALHALRLRINLAANIIHEVDDRSVEMAIHRLRLRLKPFGIVISRARGKGFYLDADNKARLAAIRIPPAS